MPITCTECGAELPSHGSFNLHQFHHAEGVATPGSAPSRPTAATPVAASPRSQRETLMGQAAGLGIMILVVMVGAVGSLFVVDDKAPSAVPVVAGAGSGTDIGTGGGTGGGTEAQVAATKAAAEAARSLPAGFRAVSRPADGFTIALPADLEELPLSADQLTALASQLRRTNPKVPSLLTQNQRLVEQARLFALDKSSGNSQIVQRIVVGANTSINELPAGTFSDVYRKIGAASVDEGRVKIAAGDAVKVVAVMTLGPVSVRIVQHVLVQGSSVWILTYSEGDGASSETATAIANTFHFVD